MLYFLLIILVLLILLMLVRIRVRFRFGPDRRLVFVGLGRTGPEFDLAERVGRVRLCGLKVGQFAIDREKKKAPETPRAPKPPKPVKGKPKAKKRTRRPTFAQLRAMVPSAAKAAWNYSIGLLKAVIVEELNGEITAGFDSPDLTGKVFGYYQAALGAVPAIAGRFAYIPDWSGPSISGAVRGSVALPVYRLVFLTIRLVFQLPLRELIKLAIGRKKGGQDG